MSGHVIPKSTYFLIFGSLLALTALTTGMAFVDLGPWNTVVALVIACFKASLVLLFFMHLRWSAPLNRVVWLSALLWLVILIGLTSIDFLSRSWTPMSEGWETSALHLPPPRPQICSTGGNAEISVAFRLSATLTPKSQPRKIPLPQPFES